VGKEVKNKKYKIIKGIYESKNIFKKECIVNEYY